MAARGVSIEVGQSTAGNRVVEQARDALAAFVRSAPEGSKLPPERELAQRLGVSRTTLRDGVSRLSFLGLLEVRHGDGTYVRAPDATSLALPFRSLLESSHSAPEELLALKRLLEPDLAAQAAQSCSDEQVLALRAALQSERAELARELTTATSGRRPGRRAASRRSLEALMVDAVGPSLIGTLVGLASELLRPILSERLPVSLRQLTVEQRAAVVEAIAVGEPDAARGAMEVHLNTVTKALHANSGGLGNTELAEAIAV